MVQPGAYDHAGPPRAHSLFVNYAMLTVSAFADVGVRFYKTRRWLG